MRVYIDIDDVLSETAFTLCQLAAREFDRHVAYEDVKGFDLKQVFGLSDGEMARFSILSHDPAWLGNYPETPGAANGVKALVAAGADVNIITGRPAFAHRATEVWLDRIGLGDLPVEYVDKYGRTYARQRDDPPTVSLAELLSRHYDFAIDDSPVILKSLASWRETRILVFDRPWNRAFPLAPNMTRVCSWPEIVATIEAEPLPRLIL